MNLDPEFATQSAVLGYVVGQEERNRDGRVVRYTLSSPLRAMTYGEAQICLQAKAIEYPNLNGWRVFELHGLPGGDE